MVYGKGILTKYPSIDPYKLSAFAIIIVAIGLRVLLVALGWPPLDSDEGTMGLMGMHIAYRGEFPIFFYGQGYMGTFEAYLAAILFSLFGVSTFTLLLGLILMFAGFLVAIYCLTSLLYSKKLAIITLVLLSLGSNPMLSRELVAIGGYPETLLFGTIVMLLAAWLVLTSIPSRRPPDRRRLLAYSAWGLVAGIGVWTHMLVAPFVLASGLLLLLFCWRELLGWASLCLLVALLIGISPMIIYNIWAPPGQDTLSYLLKVHSGSGVRLPPFPVLFPQQVSGALLVSLPTATGANPLCSASDALSLSLEDWHAVDCTLVHAGWPLGIIALWLLALVLIVRALWQIVPARPWSAEKRKSVILHVARLALLATGAMTLLLYVISPDAALYPVPTSRYLIGLLVSTPAILWPLWSGANVVKPLVLKLSARVVIAVRLAFVSMVLRRCILLLLGLVYLMGTLSIFTGVPAAPPLGIEQRWGRFALQVNDQHLDLAATQKLNRQQYALIDNLLRIGATHIYSDYWTCNRLMFQSRERVICSVLNEKLKTGQNRYALYHATVAADPHACYVFPLGSPQDAAFAQRVALLDPHHEVYQRLSFDGYVVYQPRG
jgi:4-amino-4-deoxy-L-arabinose transferase-like glycosyltransferase